MGLPLSSLPLSSCLSLAKLVFTKYYLLRRGFGNRVARDCCRLVRRHETCDIGEHMQLLRLQSSEGKFTMSREIEPGRRSFRRHRSCTFTEVARSVPSRSGTMASRRMPTGGANQSEQLSLYIYSIYIYIYIYISIGARLASQPGRPVRYPFVI